MARMLGRYQTPGCCPGTREGWHRMRHMDGPDCSGGDTSTRWRKRVERRDVTREAGEWRFSRAWSDWLSPEDQAYDAIDCRHGCNGDCVESGSDACSFTCHVTRYSQSR